MCHCSRQLPGPSWLKPDCATQSFQSCSAALPDPEPLPFAFRTAAALLVCYLAGLCTPGTCPRALCAGLRGELWGGDALLETSTFSCGWELADCCVWGRFLAQGPRHLEALLVQCYHGEVVHLGDWWEHHQGGMEHYDRSAALGLVTELLRPPFSQPGSHLFHAVRSHWSVENHSGTVPVSSSATPSGPLPSTVWGMRLSLGCWELWTLWSVVFLLPTYFQMFVFLLTPHWGGMQLAGIWEWQAGGLASCGCLHPRWPGP